MAIMFQGGCSICGRLAHALNSGFNHSSKTNVRIMRETISGRFDVRKASTALKSGFYLSSKTDVRLMRESTSVCRTVGRVALGSNIVFGPTAGALFIFPHAEF
jgi:hypothetical protein